MLDKVKNTIEKYSMLSPSDKVFVALSGGADSVCLLLCLKKLGIDVSALHINHHLRGEESDRDMNFCKKLCHDLGVELFVHHLDVKAYCEKTRKSTELSARELRYGIFKAYENKGKIATAHNLNDCLETTLLNLSRGTGIKGLCGVPPKRDNLIRPLCQVSRKEIEEYLSAEKQTFVTDSTNLSDDYTRNKIRHLVIPQLQSINTGLFSSYQKTRENLFEDNDYLEGVAEKALEEVKTQWENTFDLNALNSLHNAVKSRVIAEILKQYGVEVCYEKIKLLEKAVKENTTVEMKKGVYFSVNEDTLKVTFSQIRLPKIRIEAKTKNDIIFFDRIVRLEIVDADSVHKNFTNNILDYDKIKGKLFLRNRLDGDRISLCGRGFTSSVKKLFNENVPKNLRDTRVILEDEEGIVFLEGFGCAERVKIDDQSLQVLKISTIG